MDLIIRNARLLGAPDHPPVNIGVRGGQIIAIENNLLANAPVYDAEGNLVCAGLVETHIHLDKTRIIDRCPPEDGRNANAMARVASVKHAFTEEDVYHRPPNAGRLYPARHHADAHAYRGGCRRRAARHQRGAKLRDDYHGRSTSSSASSPRRD